eukprot:COSAG02_NODE_1347_length_13138_cov_45.052535_3_plen_409_part_00
MGCCGSSQRQESEEFDAIVTKTAPAAAAAKEAASPAPKQLERVNQYALVKEIGHGSFGKVLMVQTQNSAGEVNGTFAMKKMDMTFLRKKMRGNSLGGGGGGSGGADEMVMREIATMKKLHHPNIARLVDVVDDQETRTIYVVSEFLPNGSLEEYRAAKPGGALPLDELRVILRQVSCALNYLHTVVQIAHRDIKPENIMLDADNVAKLIDFGTAEVFTKNDDGSAMDLTSKTAGTPAFYAPEMCSIDIDEYEMLPTDLWALGVTVYQLAYGELPFKETGLMQLMEEIEVANIDFPALPDPSDDKDPVAMLALLRGMLTKDPTARTDVDALMAHGWVTKRNSMRFSTQELAIGASVDVTPSDVENSVVPLLDNIMSAAHLIVQLQKLRGKAQASIHERQQREAAEAQRP